MEKISERSDATNPAYGVMNNERAREGQPFRVGVQGAKQLWANAAPACAAGSPKGGDSEGSTQSSAVRSAAPIPLVDRAGGSSLLRNKVPRTGLEPVRYCYREILSLLCLPFHHPGESVAEHAGYAHQRSRWQVYFPAGTGRWLGITRRSNVDSRTWCMATCSSSANPASRRTATRAAGLRAMISSC